MSTIKIPIGYPNNWNKIYSKKNYLLNYFIIWSNPVSYAKLRPETEIKSRSFVQLRAVNNNEVNKYKYIFRKFVHVEWSMLNSWCIKNAL